MEAKALATVTRTFACALTALVLYVAPSHAQSPDASLVVTNGTGEAIEYLFVMPRDSTVPGGDLLSFDRIMEPEDSISTGIASSFSESLVHVLAVSEEGTVYEKQNVRVSDNDTAIVSLSEAHIAEEREAPEVRSITVAANFGTDIYYVFAERSDTSEPGANITGGEIIPEGTSATIRIAAGDSGEVRALVSIDAFGGSRRIDTE